MTGSRRSGIRMVIPPQSAEQPVRITCRQLRPDQVMTLPPLSEGEGLACRIIQLTPATFLSPVLLEIPHFTAISDAREITVLRSETGKKWNVHLNTSNNSNISTFMEANINNNNNTNFNNITTITTLKLPQYFAIISRPRQETITVGSEGGVINSQKLHQVQCLFPSRSLTKQISIGLSVFSIPECFTKDITQQSGAISPVITVEPRRRKFHKPITITIPVPETRSPNLNAQYSGGGNNVKHLRDDPHIETELALLCSMSGSGSRTVWEDVTLSTPLSFSNNCVQFTTVVSAQFWLLRVPAWMASDKLSIADRIFRSGMRVPYLVQLWIYWREVEDGPEIELRAVLVTEGERVTDNTLEEKENFTLLGKSEELSVLDRSEVVLQLSGNISISHESSYAQKLIFRPFMENRQTLGISRNEKTAPAAGKLEAWNDSDAILFSMPLFFPMHKS